CIDGQPNPVNKVLSTSSPANGRFMCSYQNCSCSFPTKGTQSAHEQLHRGMKAFKCVYNHCPQMFSQKMNAIKHIRLHHFQISVDRVRKMKGKDDNAFEYLQELTSLEESRAFYSLTTPGEKGHIKGPKLDTNKTGYQ